MSPCPLCSQIAGDPAHDLIARLLPDSAYRRRIVAENEHAVALPSLGALRPGHLLLCPREHRRSLAALPAAQLPALQALIEELGPRLCQAGDELLMFEHGMAEGGDRVPCTVAHAHLHLVPLPAGCADGLLPDLPWQAVAGGFGGLAAATAGAEYLLLARAGGPLQVALAPPQGHRSQALRRAVAERLQPAPPWNWRDAPDAAGAHATWLQLATPDAAVR